MPQYDITSPSGKKYRVTAPDGASQDQVLSYAQSQFGHLEQAAPQIGYQSDSKGNRIAVPDEDPNKQPTGTGPSGLDTSGDQTNRNLGLGLRAVGEAAAALPALAASIPVAISNVAQYGLNKATGSEGGYAQSPMASVEQGLTGLGLPQPETPEEQQRQALGAGLMSVAGNVGAGAGLEATAAPKLQQAGQVLSAQPATQVASTVGGVAAQQAAAQSGAGPIAQTVAGLAGGVAAGGFAAGAQAPEALALPNAERGAVKVLAGESKAIPKSVPESAASLGGNTGEAAQKLAGASVENTAADVGRATQAAKDAESAAGAAKVAPQSDAEAEGKKVQGALRDFEAREDAKRTAETAPDLQKAEEVARNKEAAGKLYNGKSILELLHSQPEDDRLPIGEEGRQAGKISDWLFGSDQPEQAAPADKVIQGQRGNITLRAPAAEASPETQPETTFDKLRIAARTVQQAIKSSAADPRRQAFYTELLGRLHDGMDEQTNDLWTVYRDKYHGASAKSNYVLGGQGELGEKAAEYRKYVRANDDQQPFDPYQMNSSNVGDSFVREQGRGADKLKLAFETPGSKGSGQKGLDKFATNYIARQADGKSAAEVQNLLDDNAEFLSRTSKPVQAKLNDMAAKMQDAESVRRQSAAEIEYQAKAGTLDSSDPVKARNAVAGLLDKNDPDALLRVGTALKAERGTAGSQIGRGAVGDYFSAKLQPITDSVRAGTIKLGTAASRLRGVTDDWQARRQNLIDSGILTKQHASDIDKVMDNLNGIVRGVSELPGETVGHAAELASLASGHKAAFALKNLIPGYSNYQKRVADAVKQAMIDPGTAQKLATRLESAKTTTQKLKVLGSIAVPSSEAAQRSGDGQDDSND
jgi:hypothetical protein